ncbi:hypothetical protein, partial [Peribacillus psychrosaccharolyticus]
MNKKKAIKIATASAIAASGFVAVAPAQAAVKTTNVNTVVNTAISKMAAAYDGYHKPGLEGKIPATAKIRQLTTNAEAAYDAAVAAIAKDGGTKSQKAAFTKKLNAKKYLLTRAQGYVKAIDVNLNAAKKTLDKAVASGKAKDVKAAEAALVKTAATFEKAVKAVYGPSTRKVLVAKYHVPALAKAATVADELKVYNAYKEIENGNLTVTNLERALSIIAATKPTVDKLATGDKRNTPLVKNLLDAAYKNNAKAGITDEVSSITALNATTVEVTYKKAVENVNALKYSIEGLTISSAVVKQTDSKTVVLTTSTQEGAKEYTIKSGAIKVGTFKGVSAVIPTAIKVTTPSIQGTIGKEVTVKATVTVPEGQSKAGIPVTVNVPASVSGGLNGALTDEVYTDVNGQVTYSYTRYSAVDDNVIVYATGNRSVYSTATVYFTKSLAVQEITAGNDLANDTKKSYKVTGKANSTYYIAIKENLDVTPDKITDIKVFDAATRDFITPYETTTGGHKVATVTTDKDGEGTFTIYGASLSATPIVYLPSNISTTTEYSSADLQAVAPTVKFSLVNVLGLKVVAEGVTNAAPIKSNASLAYNATSIGGRTYTVTVTDKDGKLAPEGTKAYVAFEPGNIKGSVLFSTGQSNFTTVGAGDEKALVVGKDGKVTFRVAGSGTDTFVKPTVFLNTSGTTVSLDKADVQTVAEVTYFTAANVKNAVLSVTNDAGAAITSTNADTDATITYQSLDQNGFPYAASTEYDVTFDVTSTFGNVVVVKNADGTILQERQNLGNTKTYSTKADANGKAIIKVNASSPGTVSVNVSGANGILPVKAATIQFIGQASTLDRINAATKDDVAVEALLANPTYAAKLAPLSTSDRLLVAKEVLDKRPGTGYTQTQLDTAFTTAVSSILATKVTAQSEYTEGVTGVTGVKAKGNHTVSATDTFTVTAPNNGVAFNDVKVKITDTDKTNDAIKASYDTTTKVLTVDAANNLIDGSVKSTIGEVITAIDGVTQAQLKASFVSTATPATATTTLATGLIGADITLTGGVNEVTQQAPKLVITFSEAVTATPGGSLGLSVDGTSVTPASSNLSDGGKKLT